MDTKDVNIAAPQKILGVLIAVVCAWIGVSAYLAVSRSPHITESEQGNLFSRLNIYADQRASIIKKLDAQAKLLAQPLEFMVWPAERKQASEDLIAVLQQQLNLEPMNTHVWVQLSIAQADAGTDIDTRIWTLRRSLALLGWNHEQRTLLTRHCVVEYDDFVRKDPDLCQELLRRLPLQKPLPLLAQGMGVRVDYLKAILARQGLLKSTEASQ